MPEGTASVHVPKQSLTPSFWCLYVVYLLNKNNRLGGFSVLALLLLLTVAAVAVHGYHYGIEDQAIYLPGLKKALDPSLYPHDSELFSPQATASGLTRLVVGTVKTFGLSVASASLVWHLFSIFAFLFACWALTGKVFESIRARVSALVMVTCLFTLPLAGTALYIVDQHLHPRTLASALALMAIAVVLPHVEGERRPALKVVFAAACIAASMYIHVLMGFFGAIFVAILLLPEDRFGRRATIFGAFLPFSNFFQSANAGWLEATRTRTQHYLLQWEWYEWLGAIGPIVLLWLFSQIADSRRKPLLADLCIRTASFGLLGIAFGLATLPSALERVTPYQPMRMFHLVYIVFLLIAGGLLGELVLRRSVLRWVVLYTPLAFGMFYAQRQLFPASRHIEFPGHSTGNHWVEAFDWVRQNTPRDAYFAMDPHYPSHPGEDYHGFRGIAERSQMADWDKDSGVVSLFPSLGERWQREVHASLGWNTFKADDFQRLKRDFGVNWAVVAKSTTSDQRANGPTPEIPKDCPYQNEAVYVCRL